MSHTDGRTRTESAFAKYYEKKETKARAKNRGKENRRTTKAGKNTIEVRERHLRHLREVLIREGVTHIGMITQEHVDTAYDECVSSMTPRAADELSQNTIRNVVTSFKAFIKFQIRTGAIPQAKYEWLVEDLPDLEYFQRKMLIIPGSDWPDIFKIAHKRHIMDRVIIELAYYLAMRISEASTVRWMDLDLDNNDVQFFRAKRSDHMTLAVHPALKETLLELRRWLEDMGTPPEPEWPIVLARVTAEHGPSKHVTPEWPCQPGVRMDPNTIRRGLRAALLGFGITPVQMICQGMHIARRSRACQMYRDGVDPRILGKILGHKDFRTTLEYIRDGLDENEIREALSKPLATQDIDLHAGTIFVKNTPAKPRSQEAVAGALLALFDAGIFSEEEARVVLMRAINKF
jgi:integrase